MVGNNAICYEAIQRVFRNAVVGFLRDRMTRVFPGDCSQRLKKPFRSDEQWAKVVKNVAESRICGGTETAVRDDFDYLGVTNFHQLFEEYFDKLFSAAAGHLPMLPRPSKSRLLGNLKSISDARNPLSHPVEEEVSYEEGFGLLTDARQVLLALGYQEEAQRISELAARLNGGDESVSRQLIRQLPTEDSIYVQFVGRGTLLRELGDWFADRSHKRCLLAGDGGKGKSAVAYRYAQELTRSPGDYQLVIWLSAKRRRYQEGITIPIDAPDYTDLASAVDRLLVHYGFSEDLEKLPAEKREKLITLLNEFPAFLVVDDIDTVLHDTEVVEFFTFEVPRTKSAVLLTSRQDIPGVRRFSVGGFESDEADAFVRSRVQLYGLDPAAFPPQVVQQIADVADGSPLYMDDLMRLTKVLEVRKAIAAWADRRGDEARKYALQRELEGLSGDAKKVLIAAVVTDGPVSFAELESVSDIPEDRLTSALQDLQTLFLFPRPRVVEGEQRFDLNSNTRKLVQLVEGKSDQYGRIETKSRAVSGKLPDVRRGTIGALIRQAHLLMNNDRFPEAETLLISATDKYPNAADFEGFLGFLYRRWGRVADARARFGRAHMLRCRNIETYRQWVRLEMSEKEWTRAIEAAEKGLRRLPSSYELIQLKNQARFLSGRDFAGRLQREKAERLWREAAEELKGSLKSPEVLQPGERDISAQMYRTLIICLDLLGDVRELNDWFARWKAEHPDDLEVRRQEQFIARKRGALFAVGRG